MNVAIIPARCGSKSIINKNLQKLGTKSLVDRAINSAIDSRLFSQIILTTDIPSLVEEYESDPRITLRRRPESLCQDESLMLDTVLDAMDAAKVTDNDICFLLQPTSPFRERDDFKSIMKMFVDDSGTESVISVTPVGAHHPNRMYTIKHNVIWPLKFTGFENKQSLPDVYLRSGHFYCFRAKAFREQKTFFLKSCRPYLINRNRAANVDEEFDLIVAKLLVNEGLCR